MRRIKLHITESRQRKAPIVKEMASEYRELVSEYEVDDPALVSAVVSAIAFEFEDEEDGKNEEELPQILHLEI